MIYYLQKFKTKAAMIKISCILVCSLFVLTKAYAQQAVQGKVTDENGSGLPGVNVLVKETNVGSITDVDGNYKLDVPEGANTLIFSYVGYLTEEVEIGGRSIVDISLAPDISTLSEIVVVGYGSQIKEEVTGAIQQVNVEELGEIPVSQFTQKLQGKFAGVQITQTTGKPGQGIAVRIRGQASFSAGNAPLYVVDGFPIVGGLSSINPNEIESITVLKDASSTSLYGSRAANGVVLIQTKSAKEGKTKISVNSYAGVQSVPQKGRPDMLNAREFAQFRKEVAIENGQPVDPAYQNPEQYGEGTDWYDVLVRDALIQDHNISLASRNENMGVSAVAGFFEQQGVLLNSEFKRYSLRINTDFKMIDKVKIGFNIAPSYVSDRNPNSDGSLWGRGILQSAILTSPIPVHKNPDGTIPLTAEGPGLFPNPNWFNVLQQLDAKGERLEMLSNAFVEINPVEGLILRSSINIDLGREQFLSFNNSQIGGIFSPPPSTPSASQSFNNFFSWLSENTATYDKSFGEHNIEGLIGFTAQEFVEEGLNGTANNFADDLIKTFGAAADRNASNYKNEWSLISYLARVNYNYQGKYFLSAAIRRDGSSRFGVDNRWGNFPSASVGWIISKENFMPDGEVVSFAKLRASLGTIGNNNIGNYSHQGLVGTSNSVFNGNIVSGRTVGGIGNRLLNWEQTKQLDLGLDLGFLNDRINFSYDYYQKNTTELLFNVPIPRASGFGSILTNLGELKFWGHEFIVGARVLNGDLKMDVDLNYSFNDNEVIAMDTEDGEIIGGRNITRIGERLGQFYGLIHDGVFVNQTDFDNSPKHNVAAVGTSKFKDVDGDGEVTRADDRTVLGNSVPTSLFGFTMRLEYKNFDLNIVGSGASGYLLSNAVEQSTGNLDGVFNVNRDVLNRWKSESDPGAGLYGNTLAGTTFPERDWFNSRFLTSGNHLIIKNITLGYNVPLNSDYINGLRVYGSVQQAFVFTAYKGANPEVGSGGSALFQGSDETTYPVPRTFTIGVNLNF